MNDSVKFTKIFLCFLFAGSIIYPAILPAGPSKLKIVVVPFVYLKESDVTAADEQLLRISLRDTLRNSTRLQISLVDETLTHVADRIDRTELRSLGTKNQADFVISGEMDVIAEDYWAISIEIISAKSAEYDSTFNADPSLFKMQGSLHEIIQAGFIEKMDEMIQSYLLSIKIAVPWWKKTKFLIPAGMVGTATITYIVIELLQKKKTTTNGEKDLPVSPDPPQ